MRLCFKCWGLSGHENEVMGKCWNFQSWERSLCIYTIAYFIYKQKNSITKIQYLFLLSFEDSVLQVLRATEMDLENCMWLPKFHVNCSSSCCYIRMSLLYFRGLIFLCSYIIVSNSQPMLFLPWMLISLPYTIKMNIWSGPLSKREKIFTLSL